LTRYTLKTLRSNFPCNASVSEVSDKLIQQSHQDTESSKSFIYQQMHFISVLESIKI